MLAHHQELAYASLSASLLSLSAILSSLSASFRLIKDSLSVRLLRTISPTASDSQSITRELPVRQDGLSLFYDEKLNN